MIVRLWITMVPGADRPYCSTTPPSPERKHLVNGKGGKVFRADVLLPGFGSTEDGKIEAVAVEDDSRY